MSLSSRSSPSLLQAWFENHSENLPPPALECKLDPENCVWIPKDKLKQLDCAVRQRLVEVPLLAQVAASGSSICRVCGLKIPRYDLRIGRPLKDPRGDYGVISSWIHIGCARKTIFLALHYLQAKKNSNTTAESWMISSKKRKGKRFLSYAESPAPIVDLSTDNTSVVPSNCTDLTHHDSPVKSNTPANSISGVSNSEEVGTEGNAPPSFSFSHPILKPTEDTKSGISVSHVYVNTPTEFESIFFGYETLSEEHKTQVQAMCKPPTQEEIEKEINKPKDLDEMVKRVLVEQYKPPPEILIPMLPFQKEGLAWMCHQEDSEFKGGILADEMGMGKTLQMISLLLARRMKRGLRTKEGSLQGASLVVAPLAAILQWKNEIERFTKLNSLKVIVYHGNYRDSFMKELQKYDVVITTYSTLEADYRRVTNKQKIYCQYCNRLFLRDKLLFHQTYYCGPEAEKTAKQNLTKQKHKAAASKAMKTLKIIDSTAPLLPTPANVYREILKAANREEMLDKGIYSVRFKGRGRIQEDLEAAVQPNSPSSETSSVEIIEMKKNAKVEHLMEMGFPEDEAKQTLTKTGEIFSFFLFFFSLFSFHLIFPPLLFSSHLPSPSLPSPSLPSPSLPSPSLPSLPSPSLPSASLPSPSLPSPSLPSPSFPSPSLPSSSLHHLFDVSTAF
ncbi:hypothetical protein IE077_000116 [Cardiosporidium cionae]|uniref:Helicase ATP-binding domain-containing protein n=1 Tax=Cardiosporidium cionae TaxID=476202 RepID=A0ABQ7J5K0_9APIC|nr:hypothetical protein IE077_000116 [Cardiosporidium cionae]|eukprot:KAF8819290.1 hypothetical protein IE077_000116 [Cardiosporidium cionae]